MPVILLAFIMVGPIHPAKDIISHQTPTVECVNLGAGGSICRVYSHCAHRHEAKIPEGATVPFSGKHASWIYTTANHPTELVLDGRAVRVKYVKRLEVRGRYGQQR